MLPCPSAMGPLQTSLYGKMHTFADSAQHAHERIDREFFDFVIYDVGDARPRNVENLGCCGLRGVGLLHPVGNLVHKLLL